MRDLRVSVAVLSGACRRGASRFCRGVAGSFLLETADTFQLCSICQELKLLGDAARLGPWTEPGLCFAVTTTVTLDSGEGFPRKFAVAAQHFAAFVWSLGLSDLHARHRRFGFRCFDPLGGTVVEAAACAFVFQAALMRVWDLKEQVRVPLVAATVTALVYAGALIIQLPNQRSIRSIGIGCRRARSDG